MVSGGSRRMTLESVPQVRTMTPVPGTNTPFRQATYTEVDDAYKEYLQKIAQMRQVVFLLNNRNDSVIEPESGCFYKGTRWNTANFKYKAREFERKEIDDYYNNYGNQY